MREIKFRGYELDTANKIYGSYIKEDGFYMSNENPDYNKPCVRHKICENGIYYEVASNMVSQYTGLKDKNGVEIYEGDILEHIPKNECNYIVKYITSGFYICPNNQNYGEYFTSLFAGFNDKDTCNSLEVIGNIYENPELLGD